MAGFNMNDYVDVAERIHEFYERFPDGRLCTGVLPQLMFVGERNYIVYHAKAYRTPDDSHPGDGWAWEPVPGPTQFTADSELQNAETAAWGRAIVALGFATKKIASRQEVQNRGGDTSQAAASAQAAQPGTTTEFNGDPGQFELKFGKHKGKKLAEVDLDYVQWLARESKNEVVKAAAEKLLAVPAGSFSEIPFEDDDIPF